jgi:hypothetical protein
MFTGIRDFFLVEFIGFIHCNPPRGESESKGEEQVERERGSDKEREKNLRERGYMCTPRPQN